MKVLVACEESQTVCKAFRELGHEAYSCDIVSPSGGHPEWHIKGDVLPILYGKIATFKTMDGISHETPKKWDLLIAHPPCTYLSTAGARWLYGGGKINLDRYDKGLEAKAFFENFYFADAHADRICIENPIPLTIYNLPEKTQVIQPYMFGEPYSKKTYLWLKNLPKLKPTQIIENHIPYVNSGTYSLTKDPKYKGVSRRGGSSKVRSKFFEGIAKAMAEQWGYSCE